jgi:urease accessory protein
MTSVAALRSDSLAAGVHGVAEVGFAMDPTGRPRLLHLYQQAPLRVLFPTPSSEDIPVAAIVTTSGGLVGGDRLDVSISAGAGCALMVTA